MLRRKRTSPGVNVRSISTTFFVLSVLLIGQNVADDFCTKCLCIYNTAQGFELQCPANTSNPTMVIKGKRKEDVTITCNDYSPWEDVYIPEIPIGNVKAVHIESCYLPKSLKNILTKFGTNSTKELVIRDATNEYSVLRKEHFQDLDMIESLAVTESNIQYIEKDALSNMINLKELNLRGNAISLTENLLESNVLLEDLELGRNRIEYIPRDFFANLKNLKRLTLWQNYLQNISSDILRPLVNLQSLDLSRNQFIEFSTDIFASLRNLKELSINFNKNLSSLPEELFKNNNLLTSVRLIGNIKLAVIPNGLFSNLTKLEKVSISLNSNLTSIPDNLFRDSINIQKIELHSNRLTTLPKNIFANLTRLEELNLSHNKFRILPAEVFANQDRLMKLNLQHNRLSTLPNEIFYNLGKLEELYLDHNKLQVIESNTFNQFLNLKILRCSNNLLTLDENENTGAPFNALLELEEAYFDNNLITVMSSEWYYSKTQLKIFDFSHNKIKQIVGLNLIPISNNVVDLDLKHNEISSINLKDAEVSAISNKINFDAISGVRSGVNLYIEGNPIQCDCRAYDLARYFKGYIDPSLRSQLEIITGSNLLCASSPSGQYNGTRVNQVDPRLLTCDLKQILDPLAAKDCPADCACAYRTYDRSLVINCSERRLTSYPDFKAIPHLNYNHTELIMDNNYLTALPTDTEIFENVTKLYLGNNNITTFSRLPPNIEVLQLQNNNISRLSKNEISLLSNLSTSLKNVSLYGNPWLCDCETADFRSFIQDHLLWISSANKITCESNNAPILRLQNEDLCRTYTTLIVVLCVAVALIAVGMGVLVALYYRHQHDIKVWLYMNKMTRWLVTEEEVDRNKVYDAFVSYSHRDEQFVMNELVAVLEAGPRPYKLCLHGRDWTPGEMIPNNIVRSVQDSRRTIIVLSAHFLDSMWGILEFRAAHTQAVTEGRARVIVILYGDVDLDNLDEELRNYLKMNTYVKWEDPWFWSKMKYAMPHSKVLARRTQLKENMMMTLDDKLDLICIPTSVPNASTPPAASLDPLVMKINPLDFANLRKDVV